jgi:GTPase
MHAKHSSSTPPRRVVAIVGRPNVGKSAIFNRLAERRIAIVHAQSGVTRDRLMREVSWRNERFELIDTGGVCNIDDAVSRDEIDAGIRGQVDIALGDAAVALFVVDIDEGIVPMDEEVAGILRSSTCRTFVLANKADHAGRDSAAAEFERFGLPAFPVSALHDRGFKPLMKEVVQALPDVENVTVGNPLKVAVVGRPNVGKSSYVNRLLRNERVIVSDVPGTTRDSIDIPFVVGKGEQARHYLLIDTAGMRRVGKIKDSVERFSHFRSERSIREADVVVLVLDAIAGPTSQDKRIAASIVENGKGCVVLVNKWDLEETTQRQYGPELARMMPFMGHCPVVFVSAKEGYNIRRSVEAIDHVGSQIKATLPTGVLNRTILDAYERVNPPTIKGKRLKIYYATQVGTEPLRVRLFVNDPRRSRDAYTSYLIKILRRRFGLEGAPIRLQYRSSHPDKQR